MSVYDVTFLQKVLFSAAVTLRNLFIYLSIHLHIYREKEREKEREREKKKTFRICGHPLPFQTSDASQVALIKRFQYLNAPCPQKKL